MFPDGECLHATFKDAAQFITCIPIKTNNMVHINCALDFCDYFPEYNIPDEELDYGPNDSMINFIVYTHQRRCATNGKILNGPSVRRSCEENDYIKNGLIKEPTIKKKKHLNKMS